MKTIVLSMCMLVSVAGSARAQNCTWPCTASYRCSDSVPETSTCAAEDSRASVNGDDFTRTRFSIPATRLESRSEVTGTFLASLSRVFDSIRAHGGSGAPVDLLLELEVTLERFEPEWAGAPAPEPWAHASAQIQIAAYGAIGITTVGSGRPGHQVEQRTLRMTRPIVPEGAPLVLEWFVESGAGGGGTSSAIAHWSVSTNDPSVTLEHCRNLPVPARARSWGAVKSIYRGVSSL